MKRLIPFILSHIQFIIIFFISCLFLLDTSVIEAKIVLCIDDDIYVMDDDGTNRRRLTRNTETHDRVPRWSRDGTRIAFARKMDKKRSQTSSELFIMAADGTNVQRLTDNNVHDSNPSWSPDGTRIAFDSMRSGRFQVHVIDIATLHVTQLTGLEDGGKGAGAPDWSPDGTQIVYEQFIDGGKNVYVMSANGEDQRPLLPDPKPDLGFMRFFPRWSADGERIQFDHCTWENDVQRCRLTVVTKRGKVQQTINNIHDRLGNALLVGIVCWMDNDSGLLLGLKLTDKPKPNYDIYRFDFNKGGLRRLTSGEVNEEEPDWIEGALPVSLKDKKEILWGTLKQSNHNPL